MCLPTNFLEISSQFPIHSISIEILFAIEVNWSGSKTYSDTLLHNFIEEKHPENKILFVTKDYKALTEYYEYSLDKLDVFDPSD